MRTLLVSISLSAMAQALHFYIDSHAPKCFLEELPKDTLVVGHYAAEEWDDHRQAWWKHDGINIHITVYELHEDDANRIVNQKGASSGKFTFTAHESGDHRICFAPTSNKNNWLSVAHPNGGIKLTLDMVIGENSAIETSDRSKLDEMAQRVKELNNRLSDIRREQVFQREREAEFRDQSESTNARVSRWILIQLLVLGATCAWQLSHLRSFFIKQKLT